MYGQPINQGNGGHYGFNLVVAVGSARSDPKGQVNLGWSYHAEATVGQSAEPGLTSQPLAGAHLPKLCWRLLRRS